MQATSYVSVGICDGDVTLRPSQQVPELQTSGPVTYLEGKKEYNTETNACASYLIQSPISCCKYSIYMHVTTCTQDSEIGEWLTSPTLDLEARETPLVPTSIK